MAKTAGIIAEYNPFHRGHQYQIEETKRQTGADYIIVVMSGNFVQRGEPAVLEKFIRTRMALLCGADLALELPAPFAVGSAEDFASGAVSLLNQLGIVDFLSFGSECGQVEKLKQAAQILVQEPPCFQTALQESLHHGFSYPQARTAGLSACGLSPDILNEINRPNNLLGVEYIKALFRQKSTIEPFTIPRKGMDYHHKQLPDDSSENYASAAAIRLALQKNSQEELAHLLSFLPDCLHPFYTEDRLFPISPDHCSAMLDYQILSCIQEGKAFQDYLDLSPELAGRLKKLALFPQSFSDRVLSLKTKQYTYTRVSRSLIHLLLNLGQEEMEIYRQSGYSAYARILGFRRQSSPLLHAVKANSSIPLIAKAANALSLLSDSAKRLWRRDIYCSHVYHRLLFQQYGLSLPDEYRRSVCIIG